MDLEGKLLGNRYEIIEKIGNGGMAMVYKAKCHVLNRFVAVKILRDEFTTDQEFIKRFEVEAQSAASITHPNIVSVYDVGKDGNLYYIVMELIQGKTLKEIIVEEAGPLSWKWSVNIAIQIASALEVAHKNKIVHRDIKPHNIIITEDGIAKVTDFGIAKAVSNSTITAFGTTIGSVHYFSPEHARGGYTDSKSDLYSLGVVLYEMLTGTVPFDADTPVSVALKHIQEEPKEPIELNENIPQSVNNIILKAMRKDTNLRYESATNMLHDLKMSLKDPDGDFVDNQEFKEYSATQEISVKEIEEEAKKNKKKTNKFIGFIKKHSFFSTLIGLILLFIMSLGGTVFVLKEFKPKEVILPNLVGINREEAERILIEMGLNLELSSEEFNGEYPEGTIIMQDPVYAENYNVKEGSIVKIVVSKGIESVEVPKVIGMEENEAISTLENTKIKAEIIKEDSKKIQAGYVISQETAEGTIIPAGNTIVIHISTGVKKYSVSSVVGKKEEEAKNSLTAQKLKVEIAYEEDNTKENGLVLKQSIEAGKEVEEGTVINLTVNKLPEKKNINLTVNLKSMLGNEAYENLNTVSENNTVVREKSVKTVNVKIEVDDVEIYIKDHSATDTIITSFMGKGTAIIKVYIDGEWKNRTDGNSRFDLNTKTSIKID